MPAQNHDQGHNAEAIEHGLSASRPRSDRILHLGLSRPEVDGYGCRQQVRLPNKRWHLPLTSTTLTYDDWVGDSLKRGKRRLSRATAME
jgi:hypothetical protein